MEPRCEIQPKVELPEKNSGLAEERPLSYKIFRVLFALLWIQNCAYLFFYRILVRIPIIQLYADLLLPVLIAVLVLGAVPYIFKRAKATEIFIYLALVSAVLLSLVFGTELVSLAIEDELFRMVISVMPFIFIGTSLDIEENERWLFVLSLANVVAMILFQAYNLAVGNEIVADNMSPAYYSLPSVLYLLISAYNKPTFMRWIFFILGAGLLLSYGTRGPILCLVIFLIGLIAYKIMSVKSLGVKTLSILAICFLLYLFLFTDFIYNALALLGDLFGRIGLSTRIFDMALEENILEDSGRSRLTEKILAAISENAIIGKGIMADREVLSGTYSHNMLYELWYSFGVIIGSVVFAFAVGLPIYAIRLTKNKNEKLFIWLLLCVSVVKLFMSSSFLYEVNLYLMTGLSLSIIRREKTK